MTTNKPISDMTLSELLAEDARLGNLLDNAKIETPECQAWSKEIRDLIRRRRIVRLQLNNQPPPNPQAAGTPRSVHLAPLLHLYAGTNLRDAEKIAENIELTDNTCAEVVEHNGIYYVIYKD